MSVSPWFLSAPPRLQLEADDERGAILGTLEQLRASAAIIDFAGFQEAVFERQRINPPVLGSGVAMPHARTSLVKDLVITAARLRHEVAFGADGTPVRLIFLIGVPPHQISRYLAVTAALVRRLKSRQVLDGLLEAATVEEFQHWLAE